MSTVVGVCGLSYSYRKREVLKEIAFEFERGRILVLIGRNGSGKSTLLQCISGLLPVPRGTVRIRGRDLTELSPSERAGEIAYVSADLDLEFPLRVSEAVRLGRIGFGGPLFRESSSAELSAAERAMRECFCWDWRDRRVDELSGGERQLVSLARALVQGSRILLLDEALSKMDLHHQAAMRRQLQRLAHEAGFSIAVVSHDLNFGLSLADECLLLDGGKVRAHGETEKVITSANMTALFPGARVEVKGSRVIY